VCGVRWYLRYSPSYRDVEELFLERELHVDHTMVFRWVQRSAPAPITAAAGNSARPMTPTAFKNYATLGLRPSLGKPSLCWVSSAC
jgi:hypothetical protein